MKRLFSFLLIAFWGITLTAWRGDSRSPSLQPHAGSSVSVRTFPNGHKTVALTEKESHGPETKLQTRISEVSPEGEILNRQTVRQKTAYIEDDEEKKIRAEFIDIVSRPKDSKTTRDIIFCEYSLETQKLKNASWARYEQIGKSDLARIVRYETVLCDSNGRPLKMTERSWRDSSGRIKMRPAGVFVLRSAV